MSFQFAPGNQFFAPGLVREHGVNDRAQQFAGYALVVVLLLKIILGILPDFWIIALPLQFYTLYVVWEGCMPVMRVAAEYRLRFTVITSLAIILCPWLIEWVFTWLLRVLN